MITSAQVEGVGRLDSVDVNTNVIVTWVAIYKIVVRVELNCKVLDAVFLYRKLEEE